MPTGPTQGGEKVNEQVAVDWKARAIKAESENQRLKTILKCFTCKAERRALETECQEWKTKYETLQALQHGRNWDDDEAERKLNMVADRCKELERKIRLLQHALYAANDTEDYYTYIPGEDNNLETLASDRPVRIIATWLLELIQEAREEGREGD
jgi:chromosome segregation ATPase